MSETVRTIILLLFLGIAIASIIWVSRQSEQTLSYVHTTLIVKT